MAEGGLADSLKEPSVRKTYPKGVNEFTCVRTARGLERCREERVEGVSPAEFPGVGRHVPFFSLYPHYRRCFEERGDAVSRVTRANRA